MYTNFELYKNNMLQKRINNQYLFFLDRSKSISYFVDNDHNQMNTEVLLFWCCSLYQKIRILHWHCLSVTMHINCNPASWKPYTTLQCLNFLKYILKWKNKHWKVIYLNFIIIYKEMFVFVTSSPLWFDPANFEMGEFKCLKLS